MDDIGPRRSPAFYWAGFLSHLVSNFKKEMSIWALSESLQPDQPFSVQGSNCGVQSNWRECARSKAFCLSTENIAWRWLRCRWCAMCVGLWLLHLRIPVVSETEQKCRNAPHRQSRGPLPRLFGLHTVPRHRGRGGPSRPALRSTIQSFMQRGALQGPGYLRSTPVAQVLCESVASTRLSVEDAWLSQT